MSESEKLEQNVDTKPLFRDLRADEPEPESTVIESLCMNCGKNVSTLFIFYR